MSAIEFDFEPTVAIKDEASKPIGKIEKSYLQMMKSFGKATVQLVSSFKDYASKLTRVGQATDETAKKTDKADGKLHQLNDTIKENWLGLDRLGLSWSDLLRIVAAFSIGGAIASVIGFFKNAVIEANNFQRELLQLNEMFKLSASQMAEVSASISSLTGHAGMTREQVIGLTKNLLDLGFAPKHMRGLDMSFKDLTKTVADLTLATGLADTEAAEFFSDLQRIAKIPSSQFRTIGAAIKYIADEFHISASELVRFDKTLAPVMAHLSGLSGKARADFKVNMLALAGSLDAVGVNAENATKDFGEMLNETSEEGNRSLAMLSIATKTNGAALRDMIKNNPAKVFDTLAQSLGKMDSSQIKLLASTVKPLGLSFQELTALAERGRKAGAKSFEQEAKDAAAASAKQDALAQAAAKRQTALDAMTQRWHNLWRNASIKVGTALTQHLLVPLERRFMPLVEKITSYIANANWDKIFTDAGDAILSVVDFLVTHKEDIKDFAKYLGMAFLAWKAFGIVGSVLSGIGKTISVLVTVAGWLFKIAKIAAVIFTPIGAAVALAVIAVAAAAYQIYKHWDDLVLNFKEIGQRISKWWDEVCEGFQKEWKRVTDWFTEKFASVGLDLSAIADQAFSQIGEFFSQALGLDRWTAVKDAFKSAFDYIGDHASDIFTAVGDAIMNLPGLSFLKDLVGLVSKLPAVLSGAGNLAKNLWTGKVGSDIAEGNYRGMFEAAPTPTAGAKPTPVPSRGEATPREATASPGSIARSPRAVAGALADKVSAVGSEFPSMMKTASPTTDRLLMELINVQKQTTALLAQYVRPQTGGVSAARQRTLAESAGNG